VQDKATRLVADLTQDDFRVFDNGKPQPITFFSNEITPFSVVILLDRSGSISDYQFVIRDAAAEFVRRMLPDDKARIATFGLGSTNRVTISPSAFSSAKDELLEILKMPYGAGEFSPVWIAVDQSVGAVSGREGRRVVLIFSDGYNQPAETLMNVSLKQAIAQARESNVMVYALGFATVEERPGKDPKITHPHSGLRELADDSGGGYFEVLDTADLAGLFTRVAEELHRQYWLGFVPPVHDGKVHTIKVEVKKPGLTVRARQTYVAPMK